MAVPQLDVAVGAVFDQAVAVVVLVLGDPVERFKDVCLVAGDAVL